MRGSLDKEEVKRLLLMRSVDMNKKDIADQLDVSRSTVDRVFEDVNDWIEIVNFVEGKIEDSVDQNFE